MLESALDLDEVVNLGGRSICPSIVLLHATLMSLYLFLVLFVKIHLVFINRRFRQLLKSCDVNHMPVCKTDKQVKVN